MGGRIRDFNVTVSNAREEKMDVSGDFLACFSISDNSVLVYAVCEDKDGNVVGRFPLIKGATGKTNRPYTRVLFVTENNTPVDVVVLLGNGNYEIPVGGAVQVLGDVSSVEKASLKTRTFTKYSVANAATVQITSSNINSIGVTVHNTGAGNVNLGSTSANAQSVNDCKTLEGGGVYDDECNDELWVHNNSGGTVVIEVIEKVRN